MKILVELFKKSVAFQLFVGIFTFFLTHQVSIGYERATETQSSNVIDISFEKKFLEFNNLYFNEIQNP